MNGGAKENVKVAHTAHHIFVHQKIVCQGVYYSSLVLLKVV